MDLQHCYLVVYGQGIDRTYKTVEEQPKKWVSLDDVPKHTYAAFVISEDGTFFQHHGIDFSQLATAIEDSIVEGKRLRGASTISQQLVKNLYLSSDRSYLRKFSELLYTICLESNVEKEKILEVYLNIVIFGEGIYGLYQASHFYFSKEPSQLDPKESAFLAMLLPNPLTHSQSFKEKRLTPYAKKTTNSILLKLKKRKYIEESQYKELVDQNLSWEKDTTE